MIEEKYCSLYVNDMHLIVMLIPYIEKDLENGNKIVTILQNSLEEEVNTFIGKVNLTNAKKNKIKEIQWNKSLLSGEQIGEITGKTILVKGDYEFINIINNYIGKNKGNKVINCFSLEEFENNSGEILENHGAILNTLGVRKISTMFETNKMLKKRLEVRG